MDEGVFRYVIAFFPLTLRYCEMFECSNTNHPDYCETFYNL